MKKLLCLTILLITLFAQNNFAQNTKPPLTNITSTLTEEQKAQLGLLVGISSQPVIYGKKGDNLPKKIKVRGTIEEVSFVPFYCGTICFSGTAKIKLLNKIKGYKPEYAYVVILCFIGKEADYINKIIEVEATKLREGKTYGCGSIVNSIDSKGVAFYGLDKNQILKKEVL
jgi:hypothetical protein